MDVDILGKFFEHNNWANDQIVRACLDLSDQQLDAHPASATKGTIRETLWHLVSAQVGYLSLLSGSPRTYNWEAAPDLDLLLEGTRASSQALLALVITGQDGIAEDIRTRDGYLVEPWVVYLQVINHATEHREQIKSMISSLGLAPPDLDGWSYGESVHALTPA